MIKIGKNKSLKYHHQRFSNKYKNNINVIIKNELQLYNRNPYWIYLIFSMLCFKISSHREESSARLSDTKQHEMRRNFTVSIPHTRIAMSPIISCNCSFQDTFLNTIAVRTFQLDLIEYCYIACY